MNTPASLALLLIWAACLPAQPVPEQVDWAQADKRFAGYEVRITLNSGKKLKGAWLSQTPDSFQFATAQQQTSYARADIKSLRLHRKQIRRRVWGSVIGYTLGAAIVGVASGSADGAQSVAGLLIPGLGLTGYFLGRSLDQDPREIVFR